MCSRCRTMAFLLLGQCLVQGHPAGMPDLPQAGRQAYDSLTLACVQGSSQAERRIGHETIGKPTGRIP